MEERECGRALRHRRRDVRDCRRCGWTVSTIADKTDSAEDAGVAIEFVGSGSVVVVAAAETAEEEESCEESEAGESADDDAGDGAAGEGGRVGVGMDWG